MVWPRSGPAREKKENDESDLAHFRIRPRGTLNWSRKLQQEYSEVSELMAEAWRGSCNRPVEDYLLHLVDRG